MGKAAAACSRSPAHARGPVHRRATGEGVNTLVGCLRFVATANGACARKPTAATSGCRLARQKTPPRQVVRMCGRRLHSRLPGHRRPDGGVDAAALARHKRIRASVSRRTHVRAACPARAPRVCQPGPEKLSPPYQVMRLNADSYQASVSLGSSCKPIIKVAGCVTRSLSGVSLIASDHNAQTESESFSITSGTGSASPCT